MFQPRSGSIHASALLVTPDEKDGEDVECFDFVPIKKVDGLLVSEMDGYELDELGLLKNDCLATKELSKLHEVFDLVKEHYHEDVSLESIVTGPMDDPRVYDILGRGFNAERLPVWLTRYHEVPYRPEAHLHRAPYRRQCNLPSGHDGKYR
jgi:DNA polymerase III, alpha subunit